MSEKWTYTQESVKCGKAGCKKCPHGPYWYRTVKIGGKTRREYVGKNRDSAPKTEAPKTEAPKTEAPKTEAPKTDPRQERYRGMNFRSTATLELALEIMRLERVGLTRNLARDAARKLLMEHHPDRGGEMWLYIAVGNSWAYIKWYFGWN
jgi:hypothetical protein